MKCSRWGRIKESFTKVTLRRLYVNGKTLRGEQLRSVWLLRPVAWRVHLRPRLARRAMRDRIPIGVSDEPQLDVCRVLRLWWRHVVRMRQAMHSRVAEPMGR